MINIIKLVISEKAIKLIELNNILVFEADRRRSRQEIKKEIEEMFNVKVDSVNTLITKNKKRFYVKLDKKNPAIDIATKLGMI